jgi:uncharacterized damage-inducible protein DinB
MNSLSDRFRSWYVFEQACNAKALEMLNSVPDERRSEAKYQKALDKMAHLVAARRRWLYRLGEWPEQSPPFPEGTALESLPGMVAEIERAWSDYLAKLTDIDLASPVEYTFTDGRRLRWHVEGILTQMHGHAYYHRGQIAQLVVELGGKLIDTDFVFLAEDKPVELGSQ